MLPEVSRRESSKEGRRPPGNLAASVCQVRTEEEAEAPGFGRVEGFHTRKLSLFPGSEGGNRKTSCFKGLLAEKH